MPHGHIGLYVLISKHLATDQLQSETICPDEFGTIRTEITWCAAVQTFIHQDAEFEFHVLVFA